MKKILIILSVVFISVAAGIMLGKVLSNNELGQASLIQTKPEIEQGNVYMRPNTDMTIFLGDTIVFSTSEYDVKRDNTETGNFLTYKRCAWSLMHKNVHARSLIHSCVPYSQTFEVPGLYELTFINYNYHPELGGDNYTEKNPDSLREKIYINVVEPKEIGNLDLEAGAEDALIRE